MKTLILRGNPKKRRRHKPSHRKSRKRVARVRRNPPKTKHFYVRRNPSRAEAYREAVKRLKPRKREFIIEALLRTRTRRFKTYYYGGKDYPWSRDRGMAERFANEFQAKGVAKKFLPIMDPDKVYALRVVKA